MITKMIIRGAPFASARESTTSVVATNAPPGRENISESKAYSAKAYQLVRRNLCPPEVRMSAAPGAFGGVSRTAAGLTSSRLTAPALEAHCKLVQVEYASPCVLLKTAEVRE